jgi:hypothetical protein
MHKWTAQETAHANLVLSEHNYQDRMMLWLTVIVLLAGSMVVPAFLLPALVYASILTIPLSFIIGGCFGYLLIHLLGSMRIPAVHHRRAVLFLALACVLMVSITTWMLLSYFLFAKSPLLVSIPFTLGLVAPYLSQRRLHGLT